MNKRKLNEIILDDLKRRIIVGEYSIGTKLPNERELALYYQCSRIPIRQALQTLIQKGIVETRPGVGTFIKNTSHLLEKTKNASPYINEKTMIIETLRVRRMIEAEAAYYAAQNATSDGLVTIEKALFETISEVRKLKSEQENHYFQADINFHRAIAIESKNELFINCLDAMPNLISTHQYWSTNFKVPLDESVSNYHMLIFNSILNRDPESAKKCMNSHLYRVEELLSME